MIFQKLFYHTEIKISDIFGLCFNEKTLKKRLHQRSTHQKYYIIHSHIEIKKERETEGRKIPSKEEEINN
jgi:hypothetical protein